VKKILIYGQKSFLAKNFINDYNEKYKFYFYKVYFKDQKYFKRNLQSFLKKNKIKYLINFAANNDNFIKTINFNGITRSNFNLPVTLIEISNNLKIDLILFLSKETDSSKYIKNFYAISKLMLKSYIQTARLTCKLRIFNIDSVYGPFDKNLKRLVPSICLKILNKNKKDKINLNQMKRLLYVKDINRVISKSLNLKKKYYFREIKSNLYNVKELYIYLKNSNLNLKKKIKFCTFVETLKWYKKHYGKTK